MLMRSLTSLCLAVCLLLVPTLGAHAQTAPAASPAPTAQTRPIAPIQASQYVLRYGDSINLRVVENEKLEVVDQPIRPDGRISLPLIGEIQAGGLTLPVLQERITKAYTRFFVDPHVVVNVAKFRPLQVSVIGLVERAGTFEVPEPIRLLQAIAQAGGFNRERADLRKVLVLRANGDHRYIDTVAIMEGNVEDNVVLYDGDTVRVFEVETIDWYRVLPPIASIISIIGSAIVVTMNATRR